jgi:hypothetical protein
VVSGMSRAEETEKRKAASTALTEAGGIEAAETLSTAMEEAEAECHMVTPASWLLPNQ